MTNQEKRERRREAALKAARTRAARQASAEAAEPVAVAEPEPDAPTGRQLLERARSIGREADLWYHAHIGRWPHHAATWTAEQRRSMSSFLDLFLRPDGTPQPVPHCRRKAR
jgi:hypothetical protein